MSSWSKALLAIGGLVFLATPAQAQADPLAGTWRFRSVNAGLGCAIDGEAVLKPGDQRDVYEVAMTAYERCGRWYRGRAIEICQAARAGAHVSLRCGVLRTIPRRPYQPDDFELQLRGDGEMAGQLTADWNTPALWRRGGDAAPVA
jgi:hypothetical protein